MVHSLLAAHGPGEISIDYLHDAHTSSHGRLQLREMVRRLGGEIAFHLVPDTWVMGLPVSDFTRKATWYRLFLAELLPELSRVLHLDLDLIVNTSLVPLWHTPLDGNLIGAVTNVPPGPERHRLRPELDGHPYFNAGVLLLDLAAMREEKTASQLYEFALQNPGRLTLRDQDALNVVLHDRRLVLAPTWNCMNSIMQWDYATDYFTAADLAEARRAPAIRHFEGPSSNKPWHILCDLPSRRQYALHRRGTPWPRVRPTGMTPSNVLRLARRRLI
jgi:lipopolysaccharide biosynthesis glycosyltransferase